MECAIALTIGSQKKHLTRTAAEAMSGHIMRKMVRINSDGGPLFRLRFSTDRRALWDSTPSLGRQRSYPLPKILPHTLTIPVLIEIAGTHGSGFYYNDQEWVYLVTAAHVLFKGGIETYDPVVDGTVRLSCISKEPEGDIVYDLDCLQLWNDGHLGKHNTADVAVCRFALVINFRDSTTASNPALISGTIETLRGVTEGTGHNPEGAAFGLNGTQVLRLSEVQIGTDVILFGYPTSLANDDLDKTTPLLRGGIVAGRTKANQLIIDCSAYFGNSGGVVVTFENYRYFAIGVAVRMIPFTEKLYSREFGKQVGERYENSGYTIVEPMDRVFEVMEELNGR
jgi:hypothetical protein